MKKYNRQGILLISPTIVFLIILVIIPILYTIYISFQKQNIYTGYTLFVGFKNYAKAFNSYDFWHALSIDLIWTVASVSLQLLIGLSLALIINDNIPGIFIFRNLLLLPYVVPVIAIALSWRWMLNEFYGIITYILSKLGLIITGSSPLSTPFGALISVIMISVWRGAPFVMIFYWAALKIIPKSLYEAAKIDGSTSYQSFLYITLPQLKTITISLIILRTIWTFNYFDLIYLTTHGGPADATQHLPILIYRECMGKFRFNYASSISVLMVLILMIFVISYIYINKEDVG